MGMDIHFEQLVEEIRAEVPTVQTICATEHPLQIWLDGERMDPVGMVSRHQPLWLEITPAQILADGQTAASVTVRSPARAGQVIELSFKHGESVSVEQVTLDVEGTAEISVTSRTIGEILVQVSTVPVRSMITVVD